MRILHVVHRFLPRYSAGTEVYVSALARALQAAGHTGQIFTGDPEARAPYVYEWETLRVQAAPWGLGGRRGPVGTFLAGFLNPAVDRVFIQTLDAFRPDVVHVHHLMGLSPRLPALARARGARVVITLHDFWFVCSNTWLYRYDRRLCPGPGLGYHCSGCALQRLRRGLQPTLMALAAPLFAARTLWLRRALAAAHVLIAPSRRAAGEYERLSGAVGRVRVVPHGLSEAGPAGRRRPREATLPCRFVYLGAFVEQKGAHVVVAAFQSLTGVHAELRLYGDVEADPEYVAALRGLIHDPRVQLFGQLSRAEVRAVLAEADVLLAPSLGYETYSLIVDEALDAGVPVLVSDHGAAAERVQPEVNGLAAPPGEVAAWCRALARLVVEPGLLDRLRRGVRAPKSLAAHAQEVEAVYSSLT